MKEVEIEAIKPFGKSLAGDVCEVGERFPVSAARAVELERAGLARIVGEKAAPKPENKMAPAPENKGPPKTVTVRRSPAKLSGRD